MNLRDLQLKSVYRSDEDDILRDFYIPSLTVSTHYARAVGYFSSSALSMAAQGLSTFVRRGGTMRLIIGSELEPDENEAIDLGYSIRKVGDRLATQFHAMVERVEDALFHRRIELLAFLVASARLDIKIALRHRGMYHEKLGIFTDVEGNKVVFQGSANETNYGLLPTHNFESINVFQDWRPELHDHTQPHIASFERLWTNKARNTLVIPFPEALQQGFYKLASQARLPDETAELLAQADHRPTPWPTKGIETPKLVVPTSWNGAAFALRPHQTQSLHAWKSHNYHGIISLATGAGKTITALYGAARIFANTKRLALFVAVPYQSLADQWAGELQRFGAYPHRCYGNLEGWYRDFESMATHYEHGNSNLLVCVVVNKTLCTEHFQRLLQSIPGHSLLFIGDECHHHSAPKVNTALPKHAHMRLGLSATPYHYIDTSSNQRLADYYGQCVYDYDLSKALNDGILTPYKYTVLQIELDEDELIDYREVSTQLARKINCDESSIDHNKDPEVMRLLLRRARIIANAKNKIERLENLLRGKQPTSHTLFYCGDGTTSTDEIPTDSRQVERVCSLLSTMGWRVARFTAQETREERRRILEEFRVGIIDALVAIRCLDEGIDVPACKSAYFLASSRNPRQFVQRRGRILRRAEKKEFAEIRDFVVVPPSDLVHGTDLERRLLIGELNRVAEFARSAMNPRQALEDLIPVLDAYHLHHYTV